MKPSPSFYAFLGLVALVAVPAWLNLRQEQATNAAQAVEAAKGVAGFATLEEEADKRQAEFLRKLGWSEDRIEREQLRLSNERLAKAMQQAAAAPRP